jgi:hypothetical protein
MKRIHMSIFAVSAVVFGAGSATAQTVPSGPIPGAADSTKVSESNRSATAEYNHLIGSGNARASASDEQAKPKAKQHAVPATAADIKAGGQLRDSQGVRIGTVDSVDADGVVVNTGQTKIKVPLVAFGKDDQGLLLAITAARFNELVAQAHQSH